MHWTLCVFTTACSLWPPTVSQHPGNPAMSVLPSIGSPNYFRLDKFTILKALSQDKIIEPERIAIMLCEQSGFSIRCTPARKKIQTARVEKSQEMTLQLRWSGSWNHPAVCTALNFWPKTAFESCVSNKNILQKKRHRKSNHLQDHQCLTVLSINYNRSKLAEHSAVVSISFTKMKNLFFLSNTLVNLRIWCY